MKRIPDRLFSILERVYFDQRAIRRKEARQEMERQDQALRASYRNLEGLHDAGMCGGYDNGCRYYPCYSVR